MRNAHNTELAIGRLIFIVLFLITVYGLIRVSGIGPELEKAAAIYINLLLKMIP
jgi:hypothetical protein